jgi:hypothetical protein
MGDDMLERLAAFRSGARFFRDVMVFGRIHPAIISIKAIRTELCKGVAHRFLLHMLEN